MNQLFYKPQNAWVGDVIPYYADGKYYLYYLHDERRKPGEYAEDTTWHLITTNDFLDFQEHGVAIKTGGDDQPNRNAYTGSVIQDENKIYHAFYTAYNEKFCKDGKPVQMVMKAISKDLITWDTVEGFLLSSDGQIYEEFDWRDPFVFWNEEDKCYWMLITTRLKDASPHRGGCIGLCKSSDLVNWSYEQPFYSPNMYITMECSDLFRIGDWWYLVFSTFSDRFVTHYRVSKSPEGPWQIPEQDTLDGRGCYAIKTATDGNSHFAFGWVPSRIGSSDFGPWEWGGTLIVHQIVQNPKDGSLSVQMPFALNNSNAENISQNIKNKMHCNCIGDKEEVVISSDGFGGVVYSADLDRVHMHMILNTEKSPCDFGVAIRTDETLDNGYFLRFDSKHNRMVIDNWPRAVQGKYQWQIDGDKPYIVELERYLKIEPGKDININILLEKDICVIYVNEAIALTTRMYNHQNGNLGIFVTQGCIRLKKLCIKKIE